MKIKRGITVSITYINYCIHTLISIITIISGSVSGLILQDQVMYASNKNSNEKRYKSVNAFSVWVLYLNPNYLHFYIIPLGELETSGT